MATEATAKPSPERARVAHSMLLLGLIGGPAAWFAQLVASFVLASRVCYPHDLPLRGLPQDWPAVWSALLPINLVSLAVALACAGLSYRSWSATEGEKPGSAPHLMEVGEGRTRFIALVGILAGLGFATAILFETLVLFVVPPCAG
jgi:hypothetical protein